MEDVEGIRVSCVSGANQVSYLNYTGQSVLSRAAYRYFSAPRLPAQTSNKTSRNLPAALCPPAPVK